MKGPKGDKGEQGIQGKQGEVGSDGRSTTFVVISNQQVYDRLINLEITNNQQHQQIMDIIEKQNMRVEGYKDTVSRFYWVVAGCIGTVIAVFVKLLS